MRLRMVAIMVITALLSARAVSLATSGLPSTLPPEDFVSFLLDYDVVLTGRMHSNRSSTRIEIERVVLGVLPARMRHQVVMVPNGRSGNVRVLAWGRPSRGDNGNLDGSFHYARVRWDGALEFPPMFGPLRDPDGIPLHDHGAFNAVVERVTQLRARHAVESFEGAQAAVLVRLADRISGNLWGIASTKFLMGRCPSTPRVLRFGAQMGYCSYAPSNDDSLVIPFSAAMGDTLVVASCPHALQSRFGRLQAFAGAPTLDPDGYLILDSGRLRVRRFP